MAKINNDSQNVETDINEKTGVPMKNNWPMYVYATEMVGNYYSFLNISGKKVLAVCGSGDQIIEAIYYGAEEVFGFDINEFSKYMLDLKIAAIKSLTYDEFIKFFGDEKVNEGFDYIFFLKLKDNLKEETKNFFDKAYNEFDNDGKRLASSKYFRQRDDWADRRVDIREVNQYMANNENYAKTRKLIDSKNIPFITADLSELPLRKELIGKKFDFINISNIPQHIESEDPLRFYDNILVPLKKILAPKGKIFYMGYSYLLYPNKFSETVPIIQSTEAIDLMKSRNEFNITEKDYNGLVKETFDKIIILENN